MIMMIIWGGIFTLQITDMTDSHRIKIADDLHNYYKLPEVTLVPVQIGLMFGLEVLLVSKVGAYFMDYLSFYQVQA